MAYGSTRDSAVMAGRNLLIDYLRDGHLDSVSMVVRYCDSLTAPDSSWLFTRERFLIQFLAMDSAVIYDLEPYCSYLEFYDTTKAVRVRPLCESYPGRHRGIASVFRNDNLLRVLKLKIRSKLEDYKRKYPQSADAGEFWDRMVFGCSRGPYERARALADFRTRYPESRFAVLKVQDSDYYRLIQGLRRRMKLGCSIMLGEAYNYFPGGSGGMLFDNFSADFTAEFIVNTWVIKGELGPSRQRNTVSFAKGADTLPAGSPFWITRFYAGIGKTITVSRLNHITPGAGFFIYYPSLDSALLPQGYQSRYKFRACTGTKIGLDIDHLFWVPDRGSATPAIRISTGIIFGGFSKIVENASRHCFYFGVSVGALGFDLNEEVFN
jgi:hypothetical protein